MAGSFLPRYPQRSEQFYRTQRERLGQLKRWNNLTCAAALAKKEAPQFVTTGPGRGLPRGTDATTPLLRLRRVAL
jgi:hypothetical protein